MEELNFIPVNREVKLDIDQSMVCKYSAEGVIDYVNDYFIEISGYEVHEVVGDKITNFIHKETPKTILNLLLNKTNNKENIHLVLKDQIKDGRYYWFLSDFSYKTDANGDLVAVVGKRIAAPRAAIPEIETLYKKIYKIETHAGIDIAETFFNGFLEEKGMDFEEYTQSLLTNTATIQANIPPPPVKETIKKKPKKKKKTLIDKLFKK